MGSKEKGTRWERHYRNALNAKDERDLEDVNRVNTSLRYVEDFFAVRMPSSGAGVTVEMPDLHVWFVQDGDIIEFAVEAKAGRDRVSFTKLDDLAIYCKATGAYPVAFVHIDYEGDFVFTPEELHTTDAGNYTVTKTRDLDGDVRTFDDFVRSPYSV